MCNSNIRLVMDFKFSYWAPIIGILFLVLLLLTSNNGLGIGFGLDKIQEGMTSQQQNEAIFDEYDKNVEKKYQDMVKTVDKYRTNIENIYVSLASYGEYQLFSQMLSISQELPKQNEEPSKKFKKKLENAESFKKLRDLAEDALNYMDKN